MIGGAALLADGIMTPAVTISSAIEGLGLKFPDLPTVPIVLIIIVALFVLQQFGTSLVGKAFGPIMWLWFTMIAVLGLVYVIQMPEILKAISPYYAYHILTTNPEAFLIIGAVFLCTTGAEALYSDLGHCGRANIRTSWIYVKTCLILNYFGQGVWLWKLQGTKLGDVNPFYHLMPDWFLLYGILIATVAASIASQALISGSFTLIAEAVRLNLWPKVKINYPSEQKGQLYVPSMNWILMVGCIVVVLIFQKSVNMEAAYGLSITVAMLMTTILVSVFLMRKKVPKYIIIIFLVVYGILELTFLAGNAAKILHGGWFTLILGISLFAVMWSWANGRRIRNRYMKFVDVEEFFPILNNISIDESIPKYSSNLVYLTSANFNTEIESSVIYSIIQKHPKRADVYWFLHVDVTDEPYTMEYEVDHLIPEKLIRIDFRLGFRVEQRVNVLFRKVVEEMVAAGEIDITSKYKSLQAQKIPGDFRFVVIEKILSNSNSLRFIERLTMSCHKILKMMSMSERTGFGLDSSFVTTEQVPLIVDIPEPIRLKRVK
jgi:KUP system potassium uptake protein